MQQCHWIPNLTNVRSDFEVVIVNTPDPVASDTLSAADDLPCDDDRCVDCETRGCFVAIESAEKPSSF